KSKSVKTSVKRNVWKTTGKVFKTIRHIWKPTGRTFTLVGNVYPLTRIATITIVPPKEPSPIVHTTDKLVVTLVYSRKPKASNKKVPTLIGNVTISWVYYAEGLGHNLFSVGQFCDSDLEVAFRQHTCFIRNLDGVDLLTGNVCPLTRIATATILPPREPIPIVQSTDKGQFCDSDLEVAFRQHTCFIRNLDGVDLLTGSSPTRKQSSSGPALNDMTPGIINSGLMRTSSSSTSYVPPLRNDWDLLFQPMFDELLNPPLSVVNQAPEVIAPIAKVIPQVDADLTSSTSTTTVDQDAPSPSKSLTAT
nr:integrase, catalytic region, zinc finger, CCHC-type, peptidase aspartic, catalytic [Tanacetum cinerariifolium]